MKKAIRIVMNLFLLHSLSFCEIVKNKHTGRLRNKTNKFHTKIVTETFSTNEPVVNLEPDQTYETDVQIKNSIATFNYTHYEKYLKFWAFGSHFNIYLKKQLLFHQHMTITHTTGSDAYIDIPVFYDGFNYDVFLSVVHGMFDGKKFKGRLNWNTGIMFVECPKAFNDNKFKYVIPCTIIQKTNIKINKNNTTSDFNCQEDKYPKCNANSIPHNWDYVKKNINKKYNRSRRMAPLGKSTACILHVVADHLYFKYVGNMNVGKTVQAISSNIAEADTIFRSTDFNGDGYGDNIGFVIQNITIYNDPYLPGYKLKNDNMDVYEYLDIISEYDFSNYCLGIAFTYRDFKKGIVGLAWVGNSDAIGPPGGICESRQKDEFGKMQSYNTLILSQLNAGSFYPFYKAALALTHEMGHSFGALHDDLFDKQCTPNNKYGNFLMYPYVINGDKPNNKKFSLCSIQSMYPVIVLKGTCLKNVYTVAVCGNSIVEDNEECDCGTVGTCSYIDPCCTPSDVGNGSPDKPCHLRYSNNTRCSPVISKCCSEDCQPVNSSLKHICKPKTECSFESYCDGLSVDCPVPRFLPDGRSCDNRRKICKSGECSKSICHSLNLTDCQCTSSPELYCHVCCQKDQWNTSGCVPIGSFMIEPDTSVLRSGKGQPCNENKGYCDDRHQCIMGSIDNIYNSMDKMFSSDFWQDVEKWFKDNWYLVLIGCGTLLILTEICVTICRNYRDSHIEAIRVAKLSSALKEALHQKEIYYEKIEYCKANIDSEIKQIKSRKQIESTEAIGRLSAFFPTASISLITEATKYSASEEAAVRLLLIKGFPMQAFCVSVLDNNLNKTHSSPW